MVTSSRALRLFEAVGIELEYMIVDRGDLRVRPVADALLREQSGNDDGHVSLGEIAWSNELVLHVIELKTNGPARSFLGLADSFQQHVRRINGLLEPMGARLMPTAMHPTMDPTTETRLWPHANGPIYATFNRIFDCRGHGWSNLQSMHVNLPFGDDAEFAALHAAVRFVLPILPALAASSPVVEGRISPQLDSRLWHYRQNSRRVPSVAGRVIPEPVYSRDEYETRLLGSIYDDLRPLDPEGILRHEWVNSRGCIARFDRGAIEIRVLDIGECPRADLAIAEVIVALVRALCEERFESLARLRDFGTEALAEIFDCATLDADRTRIDDAAYLRALGYPDTRCEASELWLHLIEGLSAQQLSPDARAIVTGIAEHGCLARRIVESLPAEPTRAQVHDVYRELCECLDKGEPFDSAR